MRALAPGLLVLLLSLASAQESPPARVALSADERALLQLLNKERQKEKLTELTVNEQLNKAARRHAENMAKQDRMSHELDGKGVGDRVTDAGYDWRTVGENLAMAPAEKEGEDPPPPTPADIHKGWMDSKGHRANILNGKYREVGLAMIRSKKGTYFYAQVFASTRKR